MTRYDQICNKIKYVQIDVWFPKLSLWIKCQGHNDKILVHDTPSQKDVSVFKSNVSIRQRT